MATNITVPYVPISDFDWGLNLASSVPLPWNQTIWSLLAAFTALPLWMTLELTVSVLYVFRRWSGLYFWAVLVTTWSISLHAIGFLLAYCVPSCNWIASALLTEAGWAGMVTGFSLVLYSRLNLFSFIMRNRHISQIALGMIITDAILFHIATFVVFMLGVSRPSSFVKYVPYMNIAERVQIVMFSVQELILSGLYIYGTLKMAQDSFNSRIRKTIVLLITIQIVAVGCSALLIILDFVGYYILKSFIHSFVYAFKLQLEFVILNEFRHLVTRAKSGLRTDEEDLVMATSNCALFSSPKKGDLPSGGRYNETEREIHPV